MVHTVLWVWIGCPAAVFVLVYLLCVCERTLVGTHLVVSAFALFWMACSAIGLFVWPSSLWWLSMTVCMVAIGVVLWWRLWMLLATLSAHGGRARPH